MWWTYNFKISFKCPFEIGFSNVVKISYLIDIANKNEVGLSLNIFASVLLKYKMLFETKEKSDVHSNNKRIDESTKGVTMHSKRNMIVHKNIWHKLTTFVIVHTTLQYTSVNK